MRADARRNVERILDAALEEFSRNPEASMADVARRAGVVRATLYVHYPTREELLRAVTERAIADAHGVLESARPAAGEPLAALARLLAAAWRVLGRYHALVHINLQGEPDRLRELHGPVLAVVAPLLQRGQAAGVFNPELPLEWMLTVVLDLMHAASREFSAGRLSESEAERVLTDTVLGALSPTHPSVPKASRP